MRFPNLSNHKSLTVDDIKMDIAMAYNVEESYVISNILYTKENKTEEHSFKHYVFTLAEVIRLLETCRLKTIATYSSTSKEEFRLGDHQIYIVAEMTN